MTYRQLLILGIVLAVLPMQQARGIEVLSAQELILHCKDFPDRSESADGQYCIRYIQGFIDGAIATDERVMINVENELERKETYTERAIRTRSPRSSRDRAARFAEFCLGDPEPLREVVEKVVADLNDRKHTEEGVAARVAVYASLRKRYPCEQG